MNVMNYLHFFDFVDVKLNRWNSLFDFVGVKFNRWNSLSEFHALGVSFEIELKMDWQECKNV